MVLNGKVNSRLEAVVRLLVRGSEDRVLELEAVVDTGFSGFLSLPHGEIAGLGLVPRGEVLGILADGTEGSFPVYRGIVLWHGQPLVATITVLENTPLLGMSLLHGSEFAMQVVEGGEVIIHELPSS
ncbi:MAG TPA: clan AA aspartic protease [Thermoanaerobaculia bacterium]|nr:clan AA aspartic protease [Thermoanaerobaculia bacterium]